MKIRNNEKQDDVRRRETPVGLMKTRESSAKKIEGESERRSPRVPVVST